MKHPPCYDETHMVTWPLVIGCLNDDDDDDGADADADDVMLMLMLMM